jgi:hypothetical protein
MDEGTSEGMTEVDGAWLMDGVEEGMALVDGAFEMVGSCEGAGLIDGASLLEDFLELLQPPPFPFPPQEGMVDGITEGQSEGILETEGAWLREGWPEGAALSEGARDMEGRKLGVAEGTVEGTSLGIIEGKCVGIPEGVIEGEEVFLVNFLFLVFYPVFPAIFLCCFLKRRRNAMALGTPTKARIVNNKAWIFIVTLLVWSFVEMDLIWIVSLASFYSGACLHACMYHAVDRASWIMECILRVVELDFHCVDYGFVFTVFPPSLSWLNTFIN